MSEFQNQCQTFAYLGYTGMKYCTRISVLNHLHVYVHWNEGNILYYSQLN